MIPIKELDFEFEPTRFKRQTQNIKKWIANGRSGTLVAATGYGKTTVGVFAIRNIIKKFGKENSIIIVVPSLYLKDQWEEILTFHQIENADVIVINTLIKNRYKASLLVLDEVHRYKAPEFKKVHHCVSYQYSIGLTATLDPKDEKYNIIIENHPIFDEVAIQECLENNWVSNFNIYTLGLDLDDQTRKEYEKITNSFNKGFATFNFNFKLMQKCLDENYAKQYAHSLNYNPKTVYYTAANTFKAMQKRKQILAEADEKIKVANKIINKFANRKIITFSKNTDTADKLSLNHSDRIAYHSNLPTVVFNKKTKEVVGKKMNGVKSTYLIKGKPVSWKNIDSKVYGRISAERQLDSIINDYKNNKYRVLCTAKAVDEGANIPTADTAITISSDSSKRRATQRRGRVIRFQPDKTAMDIHIYFKDTKDEDWVRKRLKNTPNILDIDSIDKIR